MTTATLAALADSPPEVPPYRRHRWSTAEYHRLIEEGFLREGSREFLWDGEIVEPMPENPPHSNTSEHLDLLLLERFPRDAWTINQGRPIALGDGFEPQPDLTVLRGSRETYISRLPQANDVALLVEVSSTTYAHDSGPYLEAYAAAGIPVYWIVNLQARRIEVYTQPDSQQSTYKQRRDFAEGTSVAVEGAIPIPVSEVLRFVTG